MYHYQKNIGDYRIATMHFSLLEHGIYNQLLDWYYLDETPIPKDNRTLFRRLSAKSEEEQQAVLDVLKEMFEETESGWVQKRVEREITQYRAKAEQARAAGKLGGRPPKKGIGSDDNRDGSENKAVAKPTANRKPLTVNQEPIVGDAEPPAPPTPGAARGTRLPKDWQLPDDWKQYCLDNRPDLDPNSVAESFRDFWVSKPGAGACKLDWLATWRNWVRGQALTPGNKRSSGGSNPFAGAI